MLNQFKLGGKIDIKLVAMPTNCHSLLHLSIKAENRTAQTTKQSYHLRELEVGLCVLSTKRKKIYM